MALPPASLQSRPIAPNPAGREGSPGHRPGPLSTGSNHPPGPFTHVSNSFSHGTAWYRQRCWISPLALDQIHNLTISRITRT